MVHGIGSVLLDLKSVNATANAASALLGAFCVPQWTRISLTFAQCPLIARSLSACQLACAEHPRSHGEPCRGNSRHQRIRSACVEKFAIASSEHAGPLAGLTWRVRCVVLGAMPAVENYQVLAKISHIRMAKLKAATARAISSRSRPTHGMT